MVTGGQSGRLLRVPRVYNALITSDEKLVPSQAYPAVSPVLRPAAAATHVFFPAQPNSFQQEDFQTSKLPLYNLPTDLTKPLVIDQVKNNRPSDPNIPDVPPPPLPVGRPKVKQDTNGDSTFPYPII
ncbi:hypothetical protein AAG570_012682 [Ranatra chinensis]|uniref:Uncharacterized protein n=1 Tax=Ranatra chinensis TaxID=642074 RepID=A0ABD0YEK5_9HEMI